LSQLFCIFVPYILPLVAQPFDQSAILNLFLLLHFVAFDAHSSSTGHLAIYTRDNGSPRSFRAKALRWSVSLAYINRGSASTFMINRWTGSELRIGIVHARWNTKIIDALVQGTKESLAKAGVKEENIVLQTVPGSYELPYAVQRYIHPFSLYK
jgi:hypothetical protein